MPVARKRPITRPFSVRPVFSNTKMSCKRDHLALHADHLGDVRDPARAVAEARDLHEQVDRRGDLLPDGPHPHVGVGHAHHHLQAAHRVARRVGVDRGQRAVVARVHGLQHVQRLFAAHLAHDDAVRPHTQGVDDQLPDVDGALALQVGRPRFHARHVRLLQLQLGRVFDGDDALVLRNVAGERVQQRGLAGAGTAGDDDVQPRLDAALQQLQHALGHGQLLDQVLALQRRRGRNGGWRAAGRPRPAAE